MKRIVYASIIALALAGFATQRPASAQTNGQSAEGDFKFSSEDEQVKHVEFRAATDGEGKASGRMTFSGSAEIPDQDVDGAGYKGFTGKLDNLYVEAEFDGMVVEGNRAVMSGVVTGSNLGEYVGRRVLLVVEDNGGGGDKADKVTWGLYQPADVNWIPTDAERDDDDGWKLTWLATDAERKDDVGVQYPLKNGPVDCRSFPLASHDFAEVSYWDGDISVQP